MSRAFDIESVRDRLAQDPQDPTALSAFTSWIATSPAREDLLAAAELVAADYEIVKPILDVLLKKDPRDVRAWEQLAAAAYLSGREEDADTAIRALLELDSSNERGLDLRLSRMNPIDDFREAEPVARQMYLAHPESIRALSYLAKSLILRGAVDDARALVENYGQQPYVLPPRAQQQFDELKRQTRDPQHFSSDLTWP